MTERAEEKNETDKLFLVGALALAVGVPISLFSIYYFAESVQYLVIALLGLLVIVGVLGFVVTLNKDRLLSTLVENSRSTISKLSTPLARSVFKFQSGDMLDAKASFSIFVDRAAGHYAWAQTRRWILTGATGLLIGFATLVGSALLKQQNDLIRIQNNYFQQQINQQQIQIEAQQKLVNQSTRNEAITTIYGPEYRDNPRVRGEAVRSLVAVERIFISEGDNTIPTDYINLQEAYLDNAWLDSADLKRISFRKASLKQTNFNFADLSDSVIRFADAQQATFINANLSNSFFAFSDGSNGVFSNANLSGATINQSILVGADLSGVNFENATLYKVDLTDSNLQDISDWEKIVSIEGTNLFNAKNMPDGFREWALGNGAVSDASALSDLQDAIDSQILLEETTTQ